MFLNSGCIITAREHVMVGDHTIFGLYVMVFDHDHTIRDGKVLDNEFVTEPVIIGSHVWIGARVIILKGACSGDNCVIAAGSVIKGKIESAQTIIQRRDTVFRPYVGGGQHEIQNPDQSPSDRVFY